MIRLSRSVFTLLFLIFSRCASAPHQELDHVSVIYDNGSILRIVKTKSNDIIRWSHNPKQHGLAKMSIESKDSLQVFEKLLKTLKPDSSIHIETVLIPIKLEENGIGISFYEDREDIYSDAMIVYMYKNLSHPNDTLFISYTNNHIFRINNMRAKGDSVLWENIRTILLDSSYQNID